MITATPQSKQYQPYGGAWDAWEYARREILLSGPAGTGKSRALLEKMHWCAKNYPGIRCLICRKTRHSITQTAMVTYETKVLGDGWLDEYVHFNTTDQQYEYTNGSIICIAGLDKSSKIMSSEYDMVYVQEATELTEDDWEALTTRLRNGKMPYQQLIADTNPSAPTHWLKLRCDRGATLMLNSLHEDNPSVTQAYLDTLEALTGVRYLRLRKGIWAAAENMVYEEWNRAVHLVSKQQLIDWGLFWPDGTINRYKIKRFVAGVDFGWKNPGVLHIYGLDGDNRMFLLREVYRTKRTIDWWVEQGKQLNHEFGGIDIFLCDPSEPAYISQFNEAGLNAIGAQNDIAPGISALQSRLRVQGDGRTRFYVYEYALAERDELRDADHQPVCFEQEIDAYCWPQLKDGHPVKEVPVKVNDHAMDVARYVSFTMDGDTDIHSLDIDTSNAILRYVGY